MPAVRDIVIFGAGGHAKVVADTAEASGTWRVVAFLGVKPTNSAMILGRPVWPEADVLEGGRGPNACLVAIGDNFLRHEVVGRIRTARPDLTFAIAIHPFATLSRYATVGEGSALLGGAVVNPDASVGRHVSLYTNAVVEHDNVIEDYVTLAPGATLGGSVRIGQRSFVGLGAVVSHGCRVGSDVIIGAQASVLCDLPDLVVAVGNPARVLRHRQRGERYL